MRIHFLRARRGRLLVLSGLSLMLASAASAAAGCSTAKPHESAGSVAAADTVWSSIGGAIVGAPDACSRGANIGVVARGTDNRLNTITYQNGSWGSWSAVDGAIGSAPTCVETDDQGTLHVFAASADHTSVVHAVRTNGAWSAWQSIAPISVSDVDATFVQETSETFLTARGTDGTLWYASYAPGAQATWKALNATSPNRPAIVADTIRPYGDDHVQVFASGPAQSLFATETINEQLDAWRAVGGPIRGGVDAAMQWSDAHVAYFGPDGKIYIDVKRSSCAGVMTLNATGATSDPTIAFYDQPGIDADVIFDMVLVRGANGDVQYATTTIVPDDFTCAAQSTLSFASPFGAMGPGTVKSLNANKLPPGFFGPNPTVCGPDVNNEFLAEMKNATTSNDYGAICLLGAPPCVPPPFGSGGDCPHIHFAPTVPYEWAPVIPGSDAKHPTVHHPDFYLSGDVASIRTASTKGVSGNDPDLKFSHPIGLSDTSTEWSDTEINVRVDSPFLIMVHNRGASSEDGPGVIHTENPGAQFPLDAFGLTPAPGDRVLMKGAWIMDCGHAAYETEIHPPTFAAFAHTVDANKVTSLAYVNPYRSNQLFTPNGGLAADFNNTSRITDGDTAPFEQNFINQVGSLFSCNTTRIRAHALMEPTDFSDNPITWATCAPQPRPANARLGFTYRFTARAGINVVAQAADAAGCVYFSAAQESNYVPMPLTRNDYTWSWDDLIAQAKAHGAGSSFDILKLTYDPQVSTYAALTPRAGASADGPLAIINGADDQPFPFYGRATVWWDTSPPPPPPPPPPVCSNAGGKCNATTHCCTGLTCGSNGLCARPTSGCNATPKICCTKPYLPQCN